MLKFIFFVSIAGIFYVYAGYPLAVLLLSKWRRDKVHKQPGEPSVSILIAAYNEEDSIDQRIPKRKAESRSSVLNRSKPDQFWGEFDYLPRLN